jgi:hypothetical protein
VIDWLNGLIGELISLVRYAAVLVAVASVGWAYARTRSLVALLVAALTAGVFLWSVNNTDWWEQRVGEESGLGPAPAVAAIAPDPAPGELVGASRG